VSEVPLVTTAVDAEPELLTEPADGVPPVVSTPAELAVTIAALQAGSGPVAVDAERAHGFRYSQRAYLIQLRRTGSGTHLIDPIALGSTAEEDGSAGRPADLGALGAAIRDAEWVIHAANQDLSCLYEVGLVPQTLFDTELAARLLGFPRVALGTMLEELLGVRLLKEHSAADWSTRPLPREWLTYAALDVELLLELREILHTRLVEVGKAEWARQEFAAWAEMSAPAPRYEPWRRTSGIHQVRGRRGLAIVREMWLQRDQIARARDVAPGRVLRDPAIVEAAQAAPASRGRLSRLPGFSSKGGQRHVREFAGAVARALDLDDAALPGLSARQDGPPPPRVWAAKFPAAAGRLVACRGVVSALAVEHDLPQENLLEPDAVRRLAWAPPDRISTESVAEMLLAAGARAWQSELTAGPLAQALATAA
jgi:ribonuclease D